MIRFIDLTDQITIPDEEKEYPHFAFYDTIPDRFCEFNGEQVWTDVSDFVFDFNRDSQNPYIDDQKRFVEKIPEDFFKNSKWDEL